MKDHRERKGVPGRGKTIRDREKHNRRKSRNYCFIGLKESRNDMSKLTTYLYISGTQMYIFSLVDMHFSTISSISPLSRHHRTSLIIALKILRQNEFYQA